MHDNAPGWLIRGRSLHPHATRGAEGGEDGCCDRGNQLCNELRRFFLSHSILI